MTTQQVAHLVNSLQGKSGIPVLVLHLLLCHRVYLKRKSLHVTGALTAVVHLRYMHLRRTYTCTTIGTTAGIGIQTNNTHSSKQRQNPRQGNIRRNAVSLYLRSKVMVHGVVSFMQGCR